MYIRYTQPPADLYDWYEEYLQDEEEIDVKAGGGQTMTIGQMIVQFLLKLDWFSTLFPRIPVPIQKQIQFKIEEYAREYGTTVQDMMGAEAGATNKKDNHRRFEDKGGRGYDQQQNQQHQGNRWNQRGGGEETRYRDKERHRERDAYKGTSSRYEEDRYERSRSRSPPRHSKYSQGASGSHRRPSVDRYDDRYSSRSREDYGDRDRDRESYKSSSSSSHRRRH